MAKAFSIAPDGMGRYTCDECGKIFKHPGSLQHHRHIHRGTHRCPSCGKAFSRRWDMERHLNKSKYGCPANRFSIGSSGSNRWAHSGIIFLKTRNLAIYIYIIPGIALKSEKKLIKNVDFVCLWGNVQPIVPPLYFIGTLLYSLTIKQFLMYPLSTCALLHSALVLKFAL